MAHFHNCKLFSVTERKVLALICLPSIFTFQEENVFGGKSHLPSLNYTAGHQLLAILFTTWHHAVFMYVSTMYSSANTELAFLHTLKDQQYVPSYLKVRN